MPPRDPGRLIGTRRQASRGRSERRAGVLLVAPAMAFILGTILIPLGAAVVLSFTRYDLFRAPVWVGLENYRRLFGDPVFWTATGNTVRFAVGQVAIGVVVAVAVAMLFSRQVAGGTALRTVVYLPQAASYVVVALIWTMLLDPIAGPISQAVEAVTGSRIHFLSDVDLALPSIIVMSLWRNLGYFMIILLAAIQAVPTDLLQAAEVDGAGAWRRFLHVTLPGISSAVTFVTITWFLGALQMFTQAYVMTGGGPVNATRTLVYLMYQRAFAALDIGGASAIAVTLFGTVVLLSAAVRFAGYLRTRSA
jgi:ABC-type sugar transport system permease subunit